MKWMHHKWVLSNILYIIKWAKAAGDGDSDSDTIFTSNYMNNTPGCCTMGKGPRTFHGSPAVATVPIGLLVTSDKIFCQ